MSFRQWLPIVLLSLALFTFCYKVSPVSARDYPISSTPRSILLHSSKKLVYSSAVLPWSTKHKQKKRAQVWFTDLTVGLGTGVVIGLAFSVWVSFIKNQMFKDPVEIQVSGQTIFCPFISQYEEFPLLDRAANLKSLKIIGRGGCGEVYKVELPVFEGKIMAAIKMIKQTAVETEKLCSKDHRILDNSARQIRSEILTVGNLQHPNILPLLAHVYRPDHHYLIYPFMENGSLHDVLRAVARCERHLSWFKRYQIVIDIAAGLEYLHIIHLPPIIHRDLKPANILLDANMNARIADFGLAKESPGADTEIDISNIAGTVGFIAPEYYQVMQFTDKCDIYSFGVILAILVTGRFPTDPFFHTTPEETLPRWLRNVMSSKNPTSVIDRKLIGFGYESQMLLVLKIACFCTYNDPKQRPNARDVRCMLSQIKH